MSDKEIIFIHAITGLHPGAGTALGVVDMPVQRERHTGWPTIPASSIKGVLRDAFRRKIQSDKEQAVFGTNTGKNKDDVGFAGALSFTDARILAFPVRSMRGVFAWTTSLGVIARFCRDMGLIGKTLDFNMSKLDGNCAYCRDGGKGTLGTDNGMMVLEEYDYKLESNSDVDKIIDYLAVSATADVNTQNRIKTHTVVLSDDDFTYFVNHATEVTARIAIDGETKTAREGALFYQEFLPAETIFYSMVMAEASRSDTVKMAASDIIELLQSHLPPILQIGGNETIGKGFCGIKMSGGATQ